MVERSGVEWSGAEQRKTANVVYDVHGFLSISFAIYGEKQFRFGLGFAQLSSSGVILVNDSHFLCDSLVEH